MSKQSIHRYPELDAWRGLAVLGMMLQHAMEIGLYMIYGDVGFGVSAGWIDAVRAVGRVSALSFLLLVGISGYLSYHRRAQRGASWVANQRHFFLRGSYIFAWGMVITLVSAWLIPDYFIRFGILHLIGVSIVLLPVLMWTWVRRGLALGVLLLNQLLLQFSPTSELWLFTGRTPSGFATVDFWPIIPWVLVVLIGVELSAQLYPAGTQRSHRVLHSVEAIAKQNRMLIMFGRHALLLYLTHVPVLVLVWYLVLSLMN